MYGRSNTENITRVYLAITNASRNVGWMNWLDFCREILWCFGQELRRIKDGVNLL